MQRYPQECRVSVMGKSAAPGGTESKRPGDRHPDLPPTIYMAQPLALAITNQDQVVYQANPKRRYLEIQNMSPMAWGIAFDNKAIPGFSLIIPSGSSRIFDSYTITKAAVHLILFDGNFNIPMMGLGIEGFL